MTIQLDKVLYAAHTHTSGGRDGAGRSSDGALDVKLASPGGPRPGTNPEQLFSVGWSACFMGAMGLAAANRKLALPSGVAVDAQVDLGQDASGGYGLRARLTVHLPGIDRELASALVHEAHETCPYSKATRGNIEVAITLA